MHPRGCLVFYYTITLVRQTDSHGLVELLLEVTKIFRMNFGDLPFTVWTLVGLVSAMNLAMSGR